MITPGFKSLGQFNITTAGPQASDWVEGFEGILAMLVQFRLAYGGSGATIRTYLQTSIDQGFTAIDIACVLFGTAGETPVLNFSAQTPKQTQVVPTDGAMADDTSVDGILGSQFRVKIVSTGTYSGSTTLSVSADVK